MKIYQFRIPTQFPVGMVNTYLLTDPLTLIDTGPKGEDARNILESSLQSLGYELGDIERIVLTHSHVDHFGLASEIRAESSADIYAPKQDKPSIEQFRELIEKGEPSIMKRIQRLGFPDDVTKRISQYHKIIMSAGEEVDIDFELTEGSTLKFSDGVLKVLATPAHTAGSISLCEEGNRIFSGDAILQDPMGEGVFSLTEPVPGVATQLEGLKKLLNIGVHIIYPGHGEPITRDSKRIISQRIESIEQLIAEIPQMLTEWMTPREISIQVFGDLKLMFVPYAINEVMNVCSYLLSRGEIMMREEGSILFRAVGR